MSDNEHLMLFNKLTEYISDASRKMHSNLKLGNNGVCLFKHNTSNLEIAIELPSDSDVLYFYSPVCRVPYDYTEQFFEKILENNLHGIANRQATFGLDSKTQNIVLTYSIAMRHVDSVSFGNILFNFIKTAEKAHQNTIKWLDNISKEYMLSDEELDNIESENTKNMKLRV